MIWRFNQPPFLFDVHKYFIHGLLYFMSNKVIESNVIEYSNVREIIGFICDTTGETDSCFYEKHFRYSTDNILWSDYRSLNNKNLGKVQTNGNTLYIQYRFTQHGEGVLTVENISLNMLYSKDVDKVIPDCYWTTGMSNTPKIIYNTNSPNLFNPYNVGTSALFYSQLSSLVSNMFGICVQYFKTEPNSRSRDVVLKEYSIEHVIDKQNVKILVPDNQLPTRELQFNTMMIDYPVQFEVHIVKSEFQSVFGANSHPDPHDYMYFQSYMKKMYMVDAVSEADDYGYTGSYWRVSLVPYQELSSLKYENENLLDETESLIFSAEGKFKEEMDDEIMDNRKDNQLNDMGDWQEGQDFLRRYLDPNVRIKKEKIYNDWTLIADSYYDMSTIDKCNRVTEYKYTSGFTSNDERMLSFIFKPTNTTSNISKGIVLQSISKGEHGGTKLVVEKWDSLFVVGNYVKLTRTNIKNNFRKIIFVNRSRRIVEVEGEYNGTDKLYSCAKLAGVEYNTMFIVRNEETNIMEISQMVNKLVIKLNGTDYDYTFDNLKKFENKWYVMLLGTCRGMSNMWLYELSGSEIEDNSKSKLSLVGKSTNDWGEFNLGETCYYDLMSCNIKMTNVRLWSKLCEEDLHNVILSQLIVDDSHNTLIVDNTKSELLLNNKWS